MALYPIFSPGGTQASALGVFKSHSTDYDLAKSEGGRLAKLENEGGELKVSNAVTGAADTIMHCLIDEQGATTSSETALGRFLPANQTPIILGPNTVLGSGRVSVWQESGYFLTSEYDLAVDGYGEPTGIVPGVAMTHTAGLLNVGGDATRIYFMGMVDDVSDLFGSYVSPAPTTGMFAEKAPILIYQSQA